MAMEKVPLPCQSAGSWRVDMFDVLHSHRRCGRGSWPGVCTLVAANVGGSNMLTVAKCDYIHIDDRKTGQRREAARGQLALADHELGEQLPREGARQSHGASCTAARGEGAAVGPSVLRQPLADLHPAVQDLQRLAAALHLLRHLDALLWT